MKLGRKISGGKYKRSKKKKLFENSGHPREVNVRPRKSKQMRVAGGNIKTVLLSEEKVNVLVDGKMKRAEIKNVVETPQNVFLQRQNRLAKGAIIETTLGKAKITNRPSQEGCVNAVLVK